MMRIALALLAFGCGRIDYDPPGGVADAGTDSGVPVKDASVGMDATVTDRGVIPPGLVLLTTTPSSFTDWIDVGTETVFTSRITASEPTALDRLRAEPLAPWLRAELMPAENDARPLVLTVDGSAMTAGEFRTEVLILGDDPDIVSAVIRVDVMAMNVFHIGPAQTRCPHDGIDTCDFVGATPFGPADLAAADEPAHFILYDDAGLPATYEEPFEVAHPRWISAAEGVPAENVRLLCGSSQWGALWIRADRSKVERLTILVDGGCVYGINAWGGYIDGDGDYVSEARTASQENLIDSVHLHAGQPEVLGSNSISGFVRLGSRTTLRNSFATGFWEGGVNLLGQEQVHILNNTFMQSDVFSGFDLRGSRDVVIANNVAISLSRSASRFVTADGSTRDALIVGNRLERYDMVAADLPRGSIAEGNTIGELPLEAPLVPMFLSDATATTSARVPGEGVSLDGVDVDGRVDILPGAFQVRSQMSGPRRTVIKVGETDCGGPCDVTADAEDEIQAAARRTWPGGTIEVYPSASTYAGNVVVAWPLTIRGMGSTPDEVVLESREEDADDEQLNRWTHDSLITVLDSTLERFALENVTLRVNTDAAADERALWVEGAGTAAPLDRFELRRVVVDTAGTGSGLDEAMLLGTNVLIQDVAIDGRFDRCIRMGARRDSRYEPQTTASLVVNVSCNLTGSPSAVFDVAGVDGAVFANVAVELENPAPVFRAHRRSQSDSGTYADDQPVDLFVTATTVRNASTLYDGINPANAGLVVDVFETTDQLFVGAGGSDDGPDLHRDRQRCRSDRARHQRPAGRRARRHGPCGPRRRSGCLRTGQLELIGALGCDEGADLPVEVAAVDAEDLPLLPGLSRNVEVLRGRQRRERGSSAARGPGRRPAEARP